MDSNSPESQNAEATPPVIAYATPVEKNSAAANSVLFGALFFIPIFVPGVLAIVFGGRGVANARDRALGRRQMARLGIILGVVNIVLSVIVLVVLPPAVIRARRTALMVQCASQLRQIAMATQMYASSNRGFLPASVDDLVPFVGGSKTALFICPVCVGDPTKPPVTIGKLVSSNYIYLRPAAKINQLRNPSRAVLAYEPLSNHDGRGSNFAFVDGHVEWANAPLATKMIAELSAGKNPPPSHN